MNVERATKFVKNLRMKEFCKVFDLLLSSLFKEGFVNKKPDEVGGELRLNEIEELKQKLDRDPIKYRKTPCLPLCCFYQFSSKYGTFLFI